MGDVCDSCFIRYTPSILSTLAVIFAGVCLYAAEGEVGGTYYGVMLTTMGAFLAATKGQSSIIMSTGSSCHCAYLYGGVHCHYSMSMCWSDMNVCVRVCLRLRVCVYVSVCVNGQPFVYRGCYKLVDGWSTQAPSI